jgi:serine/threonine-protein kinase RsbW
MHLPSEAGWEFTALDFASSVARKMGFPPDRIDDLRTALNEAMINAIEHGNASNAEERVLVVLVPEENRLKIDVQDHSSRPFPEDIGARPPPNIDDIVQGLVPARGWGGFLIQSLVDEVEYSSTKEGNVVKMIMYLRPIAVDDSVPISKSIGAVTPK